MFTKETLIQRRILKCALSNIETGIWPSGVYGNRHKTAEELDFALEAADYLLSIGLLGYYDGYHITYEGEAYLEGDAQAHEEIQST